MLVAAYWTSSIIARHYPRTSYGAGLHGEASGEGMGLDWWSENKLVFFVDTSIPLQ